MKRIIALLLVLVMTMALFAGCVDNGQNPTNGTEPSQGATKNDLENARAFLKNMYKASEGTQTKRDYTVVSVVSIGSNTLNVTWTIETVFGDPEAVKVEAGETTTTIKILNAEPTEEVKYNLVGTITNGTDTVSVSFSHYIEAVKATGIIFEKNPTVGTAFKLAVEQNGVGSTLYFTGNISDKYLESTTNPFDAVDVYLEEAEGGLRLYFMAGEVKTYIDLVVREDNAEKANISLTTEPSAVYTWDAERRTLVTKLGEQSFYIGCYGTWTTFSCSNFSYIEDASVVGVKQFPAALCTVNIQPNHVKAPVANTGYKFVVNQVGVGSYIYFTGNISDKYLETTTNPGAAVDVYLEEVDGGLHLYFLKGEEKVYIDLVVREDNAEKANITLTDAPTAVYTYDAERGTLVAKLGEQSFYMGCYGTWTTISCSNFSYIADASVVGVKQFPAGLCIVEGFMGVNLPADEEGGEEGGEDAPVVTDPAADSKLSIKDALALGASKEHNVYTEGKYYVTGVITEISNETYGNMKLTDAEGNVLTVYGTFNADGTLKYGEMEVKPVVGDTITVYGIIGQYNGTPQLKNGWICPGDPAADSTLTIVEALALGTSKDHNTYTEGKYYVTGVITEITNETYGNMKITDAEGNVLTVYGTFNADGTLKYGEMETKPVVGDTVTIYGIVGQYNGTAQIKNGWIV